jgi:hypothetical protein
MKRYLPVVLLLILLMGGTAVWLQSPGTSTGKSEAHRWSSPPATSTIPASDETEFQRSGKSSLRPGQPERLEDLLPEGAEVIATRRGRLSASGGVTLKLRDGSLYSGDELLLAADGESLLLTGDLKVDTPRTEIGLKRGHMELILAPDTESGIRSVAMKGYDMEMRDKENGSEAKAGEVSFGRKPDAR